MMGMKKMSDMPWGIIVYTLIAIALMILSYYVKSESILYAGMGMIMGIGAGSIETMTWMDKLRKKYDRK